MSTAIVIDSKAKKSGELPLPESYSEINSHNLYLYVKAYLAGIRSGNAHTQTRADVSGGGRKPWSQKGGGRGRAGSITAPTFVGGGVAFGPRNHTNWSQKVNKKQKVLALKFALNEKAKAGKLFVLDSISIPSGKTKDATQFLKALAQRDTLIVSNAFDEKTYLAFRNIQSCYITDSSEINAYLVSVYHSVVIEKAIFEQIVKEG